MPTSVREQLLAAITTAVGGEYATPAPESERDLPFTVVDDVQEEIEGVAYGLEYVLMTVVVGRREVAASPNRADLRTQANAILATLYDTMHTDETFGGLADGIVYQGGVIASDVGKFVDAVLTFVVRYHFVRGDPYTVDE